MRSDIIQAEFEWLKNGVMSHRGGDGNPFETDRKMSFGNVFRIDKKMRRVYSMPGGPVVKM